MTSTTARSLSSTAATVMPTTRTDQPMLTSTYKGKTTNRSWQHLPHEIIRWIATLYLFDVSAANYMPQIWDLRENWPSRMVYAILRDANDVEKIMRICPSWYIALETHLFWHQACATIDPHETLAHHAIIRANPATSNHTPTVTYRIPPYRHFRNITSCSCFVCRINFPNNGNGLAIAKRSVHTPFLGNIFVCREHRRNTFCGLCLRQAPPLECDTDYNPVSCVENEDEETWPGVETTCRACRSEWLWRRVAGNPRDREAVGGPKWNSPDWETRQSIEAFIEMGEGTISDVVLLAQEKRWLRDNTKLPDMLSQALAASRYATREEGFGAGVGYGSEEDMSEDDVDDEEDPELMSLTEDAGGVRDLAISDWARQRILDGHWFSPADQWYGNSVPNHPTVVRAVHPCPWNLDVDTEDTTLGEAIHHPRPATVRADVPPSFQLCEQAYIAYQKQLRSILLPAMSNIVRRLVMECEVDGVDPALRAARMEMEDVLGELREEAVWYKGIDWLERREVRRRENDRNRTGKGKEGEGEGDDSSAESKSDGSNTTSPVLSTSTLQTTPSPPPCDWDKDREKEKAKVKADKDAGQKMATPVTESPVLLHPIPYVPVTVAHMPHYSMESFKMVWREACGPLYHCRCKICERAMAKANVGINRGNSAVSALRAVVEVVQSQKLERPVEIKIGEVDVGTEVEEEVEEESEEESEETEGESVVEEEEDEDFIRATAAALARTWGKSSPSSRKRGSEELSHEEDCADSDGPGHEGHYMSSKRARRHDGEEGSGSVRVETESPSGRLKRRSEELDDDAGREEQGVKKRVKVDEGEESSARSITGARSSSPSCKAKLSSSSPAYVSHPRSLINNSRVPPPGDGGGSETRTDVEQLCTKVEVDAG